MSNIALKYAPRNEVIKSFVAQKIVRTQKPTFSPKKLTFMILLKKKINCIKIYQLGAIYYLIVHTYVFTKKKKN